MSTAADRRRLREVFGEDSEQTGDDQPGPDERRGERPAEGGIDDDWWQAQRPPHHE